MHQLHMDDGKTVDIDSQIEMEIPSLSELYRCFHEYPELAGSEQYTAERLAAELRSLGLYVYQGIGLFQNPSFEAHGVVGFLYNGTGPTVLVRADMDALPVEEMTQLPYRSKVKNLARYGKEVGVMHACGHDIHMTCLVGTARILNKFKNIWRGTVVFIGQPAEEDGDGAQAMIAGGAIGLGPIPNYVLALHCTNDIPAGCVGYTPGNFMAFFCEMEIVIHGTGGHGASPQLCKDPIVIAAQLVLALQTIISREISPHEPAILTIGSIQGGEACNIIPSEVKLRLSIRGYNKDLCQQICSSIKRITEGIAHASGLPKELFPSVSVISTSPPVFNNFQLTEKLSSAWKKTLGREKVVCTMPSMMSEDFSYWSLDGKIPSCMFWLGIVDPIEFEQMEISKEPLPPLHSPFFAPCPEPAIRTGVKAFVVALLELLSCDKASIAD